MNRIRIRTQSTPSPRRSRRGLRALKLGLAVTLLSIISLVALPMLSPELGATMADGLRSIIGPEPVAQLESLSFQIQDVVNQIRYQLSGGQSQISWADSSQPVAGATPVSALQASAIPTSASSIPTVSTLAATGVPTSTSTTRTVSTPTATAQPTATPPPSVVEAPPQIDGGWQPFGSLSSVQPIMARASVKPDTARPYAEVALIRFDLSLVEFDLVPGTVEPLADKGTTAFPRSGNIPAEVQASAQLVAAFNGGFKAVHGHYGMMVDQMVIQYPLDGIATLAFYRDGQVRLGAWGRDMTTTLDLIDYRQNCPLLVDAGQINPSVTSGSRQAWGYTVNNADTTWRSGLGLSRDGRFLIYAVGNSLTVEALARALQQGGAFNAMQLDINGFYTRFVTYQSSSNAQTPALVAHKLLNQMTGDQLQFLKPYDRDFFYVTAKQDLHRPTRSEKKEVEIY